MTHTRHGIQCDHLVAISKTEIHKGYFLTFRNPVWLDEKFVIDLKTGKQYSVSGLVFVYNPPTQNVPDNWAKIDLPSNEGFPFLKTRALLKYLGAGPWFYYYSGLEMERYAYPQLFKFEGLIFSDVKDKMLVSSYIRSNGGKI